MRDAQIIEDGLTRLADRGIDIRLPLLEKFLAAFSDRRAAFLNLDAGSRRITDETLQMLYGQACEESWVWPMVAELVATHRHYGALARAEYDQFIDLTVDEVKIGNGAAWTQRDQDVWDRHAKALKDIVARAMAEWDHALRPHGDQFSG